MIKHVTHNQIHNNHKQHIKIVKLVIHNNITNNNRVNNNNISMYIIYYLVITNKMHKTLKTYFAKLKNIFTNNRIKDIKDMKKNDNSMKRWEDKKNNQIQIIDNNNQILMNFIGINIKRKHFIPNKKNKHMKNLWDKENMKKEWKKDLYKI